MTLPAGTRLGTYEILSPIGAGGMGEVYRRSACSEVWLRHRRAARGSPLDRAPDHLAALRSRGANLLPTVAALAWRSGFATGSRLADPRSTARLTPSLRFAPAARTSSLPSVGRLFASRATGTVPPEWGGRETIRAASGRDSAAEMGRSGGYLRRERQEGSNRELLGAKFLFGRVGNPRVAGHDSFLSDPARGERTAEARSR
jgi:hypothetical protein